MVHTAEGVARRFAMRDVRVDGAALDPSGLRVLRVTVGDESDDMSRPDPTTHPSPVLTAGLATWAARLGTPAALPNVYLPGQKRLSEPHTAEIFTGERLDRAARGYLTGAPDAAALRTRARILQWLAVRATVDSRGTRQWASVTCGPAYPLAGALMHAEQAGARVVATFVDTCTDALEVSRRVVRAHGLDPAVHTFLAARAGDAAAARALAPASQDLVEALGLLEGAPGGSATVPLDVAYRAVRPGGVLVLAAPLEGRARCGCCDALGWPHGPALDLGGLARALGRAGIPCEDATVFIPQDGAHAVIEVCRP